MAERTGTPVERPFGFRVLGTATQSGTALRVRVQFLLTVTIVAANVVGALAVAGLDIWVIPRPGILDTDRRALAVVFAPAFVALAVLLGVLWGTRRELPRLRWAAAQRVPTADEQGAALRAPLRLVAVQAALWLGAVVLFGALGLAGSLRVGFRTGAIVGLGGVVTCTFAYLLSEVALRPVAARALAHQMPAGGRGPGLGLRAALVWLIGTGVPVAGMMIVAVVALVDGDVPSTRSSSRSSQPSRPRAAGSTSSKAMPPSACSAPRRATSATPKQVCAPLGHCDCAWTGWPSAPASRPASASRPAPSSPATWGREIATSTR